MKDLQSPSKTFNGYIPANGNIQINGKIQIRTINTRDHHSKQANELKQKRTI
ncbi:hypothetical protein Fmac_026717 [Flemingia macrophylla]|uniref:Uncharacterized protein n=1 Tax=Flemingia macrophylla TaxID=520843 RepID=A0ABD1LG79_9FABA